MGNGQWAVLTLFCNDPTHTQIQFCMAASISFCQGQLSTAAFFKQAMQPTWPAGITVMPSRTRAKSRRLAPQHGAAAASWADTPQDVLLLIVKNIDTADQLSMARTCSAWRRLLNDCSVRSSRHCVLQPAVLWLRCTACENSAPSLRQSSPAFASQCKGWRSVAPLQVLA